MGGIEVSEVDDRSALKQFIDLPYSLYRRITPLFLRPELAVARQLGAFGLKPPDIRLIFVSHFHADHIAGLRDFPDATYVTLRAA